jgi:uncharacterized GH25 family protein
MKKIFLLLLTLIVVRVSGHEFWIQPDKFIYKYAEPVNIRFLVGENFTGENWAGDKDKIKSLRLYFGDVADKNCIDNVGGNKGDSLQIAMLDEGTVMVTLNTTNSFIDLEAAKFNDYLREDGLTESLKYRERNGDTAKNGRENYQRSVKTIFQVGSRFTNVFKRRTDIPLDIVPAEHPYTVSKDGDFKVKLFFRGERLKKTKVKVWHKLDDKISQEEYTTDDEGEVKFFLSPEGEWMVSCVKMIRLEDDPKAEWQSYWGSMTWGYY